MVVVVGVGGNEKKKKGKKGKKGRRRWMNGRHTHRTTMMIQNTARAILVHELMLRVPLFIYVFAVMF